MRTYGLTMLPDNGSIVPVLMPFYTVEAHNSLERGSRPYSVVEILREVFKEDFSKAIQVYMERCPEGAAKAIGVDEARNFKLLWLSEPKVESSLKQPACTTAVDLVFKASVEAMVPCSILAKTEGDSEQQEAAVMEKRRYTADYRMRYYIGLWHKNCSAPAIAPAAYFPKDEITEQKTAITNQYLLPIMYAEDYVKAGRRMLERYYPEALDRPTAVDGMELARRMQLEVRRVRFEQGSDIQGRIYFDWTWVKLRDESGNIRKEKIPPMTILINTDLCPTPEIENSTVIHECCHVFLDLPFFKLQMLSGKPFTSYTSRKRKKKQFNTNNGPIDWMELQAEKLPAYVLLEENNTRNEIERLLAERGGARSPENIFWIICQLASTFKVSRSMAKYRMIELGYPEAEGVYAYIDNVRIPDYGCSGLWERGITYAISLADAGALLRESREFSCALQGGRYVYIEGHFCLNEEAYVQRSYRQIQRLTAYARRHIEECCIAFTVQGRYANTAYEDAQAARKKEVKDKYQSRHGFGAEPESKERLKENKTFAEDSQIWMKLRMRMPEGIGAAIQLILGEEFLGGEAGAMVLGDNIFYGNGFRTLLKAAVKDAEENERATVFGYYVPDPERFGVVEFDESGKALSIEEKPKEPKSNYAVTGLYFYPAGVSKRANMVQPSARGELEITTLNEMYLNDGLLDVQLLGRGFAWLDTGTMSSLLQAANFVEMIQSRQGITISAPEEIAYINGFIDKEKLMESAKAYGKSPYGEHLKAVAEGKVRY